MRKVDWIFLVSEDGFNYFYVILWYYIIMDYIVIKLIEKFVFLKKLFESIWKCVYGVMNRFGECRVNYLILY